MIKINKTFTTSLILIRELFHVKITLFIKDMQTYIKYARRLLLWLGSNLNHPHLKKNYLAAFCDYILAS